VVAQEVENLLTQKILVGEVKKDDGLNLNIANERVVIEK